MEKNSQEPPEGGQARPGRGYVLNDSDLVALIGLVVSIVGVLSCVSGGAVCFIIPIAGLALGIVGWIQANRAINPQRARIFSMISTISMAVVFALVVLAVLAYFTFIIIMVVAGASAGSG